MGEQPILGADTSRLEIIGEAWGATAEQKAFDSEYSSLRNSWSARASGIRRASRQVLPVVDASPTASTVRIGA